MRFAWRVLYDWLAWRYPAPWWTVTNYGYLARDDPATVDTMTAGAALYRRVAGPLHERRSVLDIGCGRGGGLAALLADNPGLQAVGIDQSLVSLSLARARVPRVDFRAADFARLPVAAGAFDLVISVEALHHAENLSAAIREARRVVAPGGALRIATFLTPGQVRLLRAAGPWDSWVDLAPEVHRALVATAAERARRVATAAWPVRPLLRRFAGSAVEQGLASGALAYPFVTWRCEGWIERDRVGQGPF